jgi:hypothetical protein
MPSRTLLIDGSSTSSPNGGIVQPPMTPYHVIYMSDQSDVNRPTCHSRMARRRHNGSKNSVSKWAGVISQSIRSPDQPGRVAMTNRDF